MKETQDDRNKLKDIPCSWIRRINIIKMPYYPKQSTDAMQFFKQHIRFHGTRANNSKLVWNHKRSLKSQTSLEKEKQNWR